MNEERLIDLEMKITHQEMQIEQLSKALYEQQTQMDQLEATLKALAKRFQKTGAEEIGPADVKPPHY